jgi:2-polyprenyl-3-methyl-5-hydroxy-6-metoxy-1,4-benzoquinol methylase
MQNLLASYPCPVCAAASTNPLLTIKEFRIVRCAVCGMVYVDPRVRNEEIFNIYRNEYFKHGGEGGYEDYELIAPLRKKTFQKWYADIERFLPADHATALDIGCAAGYFLEHLTSKGWRHVEGIELDRRMLDGLRKSNFNVSDLPLEQFVPSHRYHLITLFDVLEHLPDINNDFTKLSAMLDDNGIIALVTPNFASFQRRIFGKRWFQFKPREHIYYFTPTSLRKIAEKHNFSVVYLAASGQFADFSFLQNRFASYHFPLLGSLFSLACLMFRLKNKFWYMNTGSMFAILKKKK